MLDIQFKIFIIVSLGIILTVLRVLNIQMGGVEHSWRCSKPRTTFLQRVQYCYLCL